MVIYQCSDPLCETVFTVELSAVEAVEEILSCPACKGSRPEELCEADVEREGKEE